MKSLDQTKEPRPSADNTGTGHEERTMYLDDNTDSKEFNHRPGKYDISFVEKASLYDRDTRKYIPARSASFTWPQIVSVVLKKDRVPAKDGWGIIPSQIETHKHKKTGLSGRWRQRIGCTYTNLLILDIENAPIGDDQEDVEAWFRDLFPTTRALIYTTWNHGNPTVDEDGVPKWTKGEPRIRIIMPLTTPVEAQSTFPLLYLWVIKHCDGAVDRACKDPCRLSYLFREMNPASVIAPWFIEVQGHDLDPNNLPDGSSLEALKAAKDAKAKADLAERESRAKLLKSGILTNASDSQVTKYVNAALKGSCEEVALASAGSRHDTLYRKAYRLGTMVAAGMVSEDVVIEHLTAAAEVSFPPARHTEARRTIRDGLFDSRDTPFDTTSLMQWDRSADLTAVINFQSIMGGHQ